MLKPKIIILEGISGCGKSALIHRVSQMSGELDTVLMRTTATTWVYSRVFERPSENMDYESFNFALQATHDVHMVWLQVTSEEAMRRKQAKNDLEYLEDMSLANKWYEYYFDEVCTLDNVHRVDTMGRTEEEVLEEIRERIYG